MIKPGFWKNQKRYYDLKSFWLNRFGCRVYKLQIDAGFTCPNRDGMLSRGGCIYCDSRGSRLRQVGRLPSVAEQVRQGQEYYKKNRNAYKFIAYFQTFTNTYAPVGKLKELYDQALAEKDVVGISVGTRPDCLPDDVISLFQDYARDRHVWVELGLQSIHDKTLFSINRCHTAQAFLDAVERISRKGINICAHIIVGLPGETREDIMKTASTLAGLPVQGVKIHSLLALKGTVLGDLYEKGKITMFSREDYAAMVCDILEILPQDMVIQRLTADGYGDVFLGPEWARNKMTVLNAIDRELERRKTYQGCYHKEQG